jgi:small subunit ribosomal protein S2
MNKDIPQFTIKQMLEAGVHFGHKTSRWNPKMASFIYGERNGVHIIDLQKTAQLFYTALQTIYDVAKNNGKILFVGTKRQAAEQVKEAAIRSGQYFVNKRWLGGMLTNWHTISQSIKTLENFEKILEEASKDEEGKYNKKELLEFDRNRRKLEDSLGGIRKIHGKPDLIFVIDSGKENIAIKEANKLGIPVVAVVDTNSDPEGVDYIIPGNDDATRSIKFYCDIVSDAILSAIEHNLAISGVEFDEFGDKEENILSESVDTKKAETKSKAKKTEVTKSPKEKDVKEEVVICEIAEEKVESKKKPTSSKKTTSVKKEKEVEKLPTKKASIKSVKDKKEPVVVTKKKTKKGE